MLRIVIVDSLDSVLCALPLVVLLSHCLLFSTYCLRGLRPYALLAHIEKKNRTRLIRGSSCGVRLDGHGILWRKEKGVHAKRTFVGGSPRFFVQIAPRLQIHLM